MTESDRIRHYSGLFLFSVYLSQVLRKSGTHSLWKEPKDKFFGENFSNISLGETFVFYHVATKAKGGAEMQSALDRRQAMLELLSDRRQETVANLMAEFGVSRCTVLRDIDALSCSAPIYTVQGNGGGVRVVDGYYYGRRYLTRKQASTLRKIAPGLQPEQRKEVLDILSRFEMPVAPTCAGAERR